jgi:WD40 repeat protein
VLVIDQFEEVFTLSPGPGSKTERQAFITALAAAAARPAGSGQEPPAVVVIAVRGDFWDRCAAYPELAGALQEGQFVVGPMTGSDLRRTITGPADAARLQIDPSLTGTILDDLRAAGGGAGVLPLLSHVMALTWENRENGWLTSHGYGLSGGISHAIQVSADTVYDGLAAGQQELARDLFRRMTVASRDGRLTRRPVTRADLDVGHPGSAPDSVDAVLEAFAARRLIILDGHTAQICHDVLLTAWPRLRGWLEEDQASWILHGQLADDAAAWREHHGDSSFLYRGTQLATVRQAAARWSASPGRSPALTTTQDDFLRAGHHAATRGIRRRRSAVALLALLTVAAMIASAFAFRQRSSYLQQRDEAILNGTSAEAFQVSATNPSLAAQLTLAAYRMQPTQDLATQLLSTENTPLSTPIATNSASFIDSVAFSPDGRTLASSALDGAAIQLWDVGNSAHPRLLGQLETGSELISSLAFSPDGRTLAAAGLPNNGVGAISLWDVSHPAHPQMLGQPLSPNGQSLSQNDSSAAAAVAFSPDGRILATGGTVTSASGTLNSRTIQLWDMTSPAHPRPLGQCMTSGNSIQSLIFSHDGRTLASSEFATTSARTVQLWNVSNAARPRLLGSPAAGNDYNFDPVAFSRAGILATGGKNGTIQLWDAADPVHPRQLGHPPAISSNSPVHLVMFSPDGQRLATADTRGTIQLWNVVNPAQPKLLSYGSCRS